MTPAEIEARIKHQIGAENFDSLQQIQAQLAQLDPRSRDYFELAGRACVLDHGECHCSECQIFVYGSYEEGVNYSQVF